MSKSRKIVLFIVEGVTDKNSLALILSKIIEKDKIVRFKIINGDMTAENGVNASNIQAKITNYIKDFITSDVYKKSDIINVIHLVDMDGAYIKDDLILQKNNDNSKNNDSIEYSAENIYAKSIENIKSRNKQKSQILSKLAATDTVYTNLDYRIYFFSSNLEHVMHNKQSVLSYEKSKYAYEFEDRFVGSPFRFVEFINNAEFALTGEYKDTWDFIKKDANSLKRFTNFNLYLNTIKPE